MNSKTDSFWLRDALVDAYYDWISLATINVLWFILTLPVITAPPAAAGLSYAVRYYGFLSSGLRQRLAALHQQLGCSLADQPSSPEAAAAQDAQTADGLPAVPSPNSVVHCPSCGQVMQRGPIIRPNEHGPP